MFLRGERKDAAPTRGALWWTSRLLISALFPQQSGWDGSWVGSPQYARLRVFLLAESEVLQDTDFFQGGGWL